MKFEYTVISLDIIANDIYKMRNKKLKVDIEDIILGICVNSIDTNVSNYPVVRIGDMHGFLVFHELCSSSKMRKWLKSDGYLVPVRPGLSDYDSYICAIALFNLVMALLAPITDDNGELIISDFKTFCETAFTLLYDLKDSDINNAFRQK